MGYSFHIRCTNKDSQNKMKAFIEANYTPFQNLIKNESCFNGYEKFNHTGKYCPTNEITANAIHYPLGFHVNSSLMPDSYYIWRILTWMALKVGKKASYSKHLLPTIWMDTGEKCPIFLNENSKKYSNSNHKDEDVVDSLGWIPFSPKHIEMFLSPNPKDTKKFSEYKVIERTRLEKISELTKKELERLNELWENLPLYND